MAKIIKYTKIITLFLLLLTNNCSSKNYKDFDKRNFKSITINNEVRQKYIGYYKVGKPYTINKITYYPKEYAEYKEVGYASWYGYDFHNKKTANGEIFNKQSMTAAHKTLPLPSVVKVTNLENGMSVIVRVNDRGPFAKNRIIDLSENAAKHIGMHKKGVSKVKVELLKKETSELLNQLNLKN